MLYDACSVHSTHTRTIYILMKDNLNRDSQQIYQHQQNEHSPLTSTHGANNIKMAYDVGNPGSAWDRHNNVVGLNVLKGSHLCPS